MGDVVDLNHYRKRRERRRNDKRAAVRGAKASPTTVEREMARDEAERGERDGDGKRIDRGPGEE